MIDPKPDSTHILSLGPGEVLVLYYDGERGIPASAVDDMNAALVELAEQLGVDRDRIFVMCGVRPAIIRKAEQASSGFLWATILAPLAALFRRTPDDGWEALPPIESLWEAEGGVAGVGLAPCPECDAAFSYVTTSLHCELLPTDDGRMAWRIVDHRVPADLTTTEWRQWHGWSEP